MRLPGIFDSLRDLLDDRGFVVVCTHEDASLLSPWGRRKRLSFLDLGLQAEGFRGGVDLLGRGGLDGPAFRDPSALVPRPSQVEICGVQDDRAVSFRHGPGPNPRAAIRIWAATRGIRYLHSRGRSHGGAFGADRHGRRNGSREFCARLCDEEGRVVRRSPVRTPGAGELHPEERSPRRALRRPRSRRGRAGPRQWGPRVRGHEPADEVRCARHRGRRHQDRQGLAAQDEDNLRARRRDRDELVDPGAAKARRRLRGGEDRGGPVGRPRPHGARTQDPRAVLPVQRQPHREIFRELGRVPHPVVQSAASGVLLPYHHPGRPGRTDVPQLRMVRRLGRDRGVESPEARQSGKSFIPPDGIGMRVGSEVVNVVDDPTVEHAIAYYRTDDEGVKARRRYLYKEGRVTEFLQNRETAAAMRTRSNGAARAVNYNVEAIVRMANTFVEPKDHSVDELLEDVKFGVYMKSFMEWNIDDKRYNAKYAGREAYLVENGEVKHPVRNTIIELTTPAFWSAVDAVGKDLDFEAGFCGKSDPGQALDASLGGPTIRLRNVYLR